MPRFVWARLAVGPIDNYLAFNIKNQSSRNSLNKLCLFNLGFVTFFPMFFYFIFFQEKRIFDKLLENHANGK